MDQEEIDKLELCNSGDYGSEFEYDSEVDRKRSKRKDLAVAPVAAKTKLPDKEEVTTEYNKEEGRKERYQVLSMDAFARHKKFINDYLLYYCGSMSNFKRDTSRDKTDFDVIRENHQFLWDDDDDSDSWGKRLAKKYYDKLFKEYCIADLSRYKENKIALRWRIEAEVVSGKGQFICGAKRCDESDGLKSWEVNFSYVELGAKKSALVKLRLCPECSQKLNYHHRRKEAKAMKRAMRTDDYTESKRPKADHVVSPTSDSGSEVSTNKIPEPLPATSSAGAEETDVWSKPVQVAEEKSREDEFDDYFEGMFL